MSSPMNLIRFSRKIPLLVFLATVVRVGTSTAQVLPLSFTKYTIYDYVSSITAGPDGALWFTEFATDKIGRITLDGAITLYSSPVGCCAGSIVPGPDGALWLTGNLANQIGRITTTGATAVYGLPTPNSDPAAIAAGPDGALWFTEAGGYKIGRITMDGEVTEFPLPSPGVSPLGIAAGPDGAMWFAECCDKKIGRITPQGLITEYPLPASSSDGSLIVAGPDGALWFNEFGSGKIGRITTDGAVTEYSIPIPDAGPVNLAVGPDGALWFPIGSRSQDHQIGTIGRITTNGIVTFYNAPDDFVAVAAGPDGAMWFTSGTCQEGGGCLGSIVRAVPGSGLTVATLSLPGGAIGTAYLASLMADGGTAPYTWSVSAGSLPIGLTLNPATGAISGTPTGPGMSFTVRVTDSSFPPQSATRPFIITIANASSFSIAISPSYLGLPITVDGVGYGAEAGRVYTFPCATGSAHTVSIDTSGLSTISGPRVRYSFAGWNDGISLTSRQITCPEGTATYTAIINVQYRLTTTVAPAGAGSIGASPASPMASMTAAPACNSPPRRAL